jgi:CRP-like cAMP-binding protein
MLVQVGRRYVSEQREIDPMFAKGMKELLSKSKVFQDCHDEFIRDLIVSSNRKEYSPNRYLMEEGSRGDSMFVLFKGVVEVTSNGRYVCKLRDGSIVGEAALLNIDNRRTASVRSIQKCDVAIIFRSTFHSILEKYPWEKRKFQREMKAKLMELGKLIDVKDDINLEQQAIQCDALKRVPFFASDESMHDFVAELAMNASSFWFRPGRIIIQEGDTKCDEMYVLLRGAVEVTACGEFLGRLENDLFGEICVLDLLERRTAMVTAATQCHCMMFSRQIVIPILAKYPDARMKLLEHARQRLMALNEAIGVEPLRGFDQSGPVKPTRLAGCAIGFGNVIQNADAHLFAASPIFQDARVDFLYELSNQMSTKHFEEGRTIIQQGVPFRADTDYVYWISKGQVEICQDGHFVAVLGEGEVFGELACFGEGVRQATVRSKTRVILRQVKGAALRQILQWHEDKEFMAKWEAEMERRWEQLAQKESIRKQMKQKPVHLDFMFLKLTDLSHGGQRRPKTAPLGPALYEMCGKPGEAVSLPPIGNGGATG